MAGLPRAVVGPSLAYASAVSGRVPHNWGLSADLAGV